MPEKAKYNADELVPPTFIDQQFVVDLVKSVEKDPELIVIYKYLRSNSQYTSLKYFIVVNQPWN